MRLQRAGEGESPAEMQIVKWTAEGALKREEFSEYFATCMHT